SDSVIAVTDPVQTCRVRDRQRPEHHGIDEREDSGCPANSQRERENGRNSEHSRRAELSDGIANRGKQEVHFRSLLISAYRRRRLAPKLPYTALELTARPVDLQTEILMKLASNPYLLCPSVQDVWSSFRRDKCQSTKPVVRATNKSQTHGLATR